MRSRNVEMVVALSIFLVGLSLVLLSIRSAINFPIEYALAFTAIAGLVAIFSAIIIFWDAAKGQ